MYRLPLQLYTSVFGCGYGFGFEQKFWRLDGFGEKKARIGGFACPYSPPYTRYLLSRDKIGNFPWTYFHYILWRRARLSLELFASSRILISDIIDRSFTSRKVYISLETLTFHRFMIICEKQGKTFKSGTMDPVWWFQKQIKETKKIVSIAGNLTRLEIETDKDVKNIVFATTFSI